MSNKVRQLSKEEILPEDLNIACSHHKQNHRILQCSRILWKGQSIFLH